MMRGLKFQGNKSIDDLTLSSGIATTNSPWLVRLTGWKALGEERYFRERDLVPRVLSCLGQRNEGVEMTGSTTKGEQDAHDRSPLGPAHSAVEADRPQVHVARDEWAHHST